MNNNTNFKFFFILSIYTIWDGLSLKTISRYCPFNGVEHIIQTTGYLVFASARRLDPEKYAVAEKEFLALEAAGVIRHSDSPWASALHMVPKPMVPGGLVVIIVVWIFKL